MLVGGCFILQRLLGHLQSAGSGRSRAAASPLAAAMLRTTRNNLATKQGIFSATFTHDESCFTSSRAATHYLYSCCCRCQTHFGSVNELRTAMEAPVGRSTTESGGPGFALVQIGSQQQGLGLPVTNTRIILISESKHRRRSSENQDRVPFRPIF